MMDSRFSNNKPGADGLLEGLGLVLESSFALTLVCVQDSGFYGSDG